MRWTPLGLLVVTLFAAPARAANDATVPDSAAVAVLQKHWPKSLERVQKRLAEKPEETSRARPSALAALKAGAAFADGRSANATAKDTAVQSFRAALDDLGPDQARFLGRDGGLGEIARELLGDAALLARLDELSKQGAESPDVPSIRAEALYHAGRYQDAVTAAREALKLNPQDRDALGVLKFSEGRSDKIKAAQPGTADAQTQPMPSPTEPRADSALPGSSLPLSFRHSAAAPPPLPGARALDPKAADYWDKQLLAPLLKHSNDNPVAREYLSPLIKANKVTIRLDREKDNAEIKGNWGYYDLESSVIHYNLDSINADIRQYNAYYAKTAPSRSVRTISPTRPLDPAQVEYVTGRFLPLAVHEAGGHGTHSEDLKRELGAIRAPLNKDTEIMAWRLEAAAIEAERRRDRSYLTERTEWAAEENNWVVAWKKSRRPMDQTVVTDYLDSMGYKRLIHIGEDPGPTRLLYSDSVALVQSACRRSYDARCGAAISRLATLYGAKEQSDMDDARTYLDRHPDDDAVRAKVMNELTHEAIAEDRLDPKGITVVSNYYRQQETRVQALEALADPLTIWQKLRNAWHK